VLSGSTFGQARQALFSKLRAVLKAAAVAAISRCKAIGQHCCPFYEVQLPESEVNRKENLNLTPMPAGRPCFQKTNLPGRFIYIAESACKFSGDSIGFRWGM